MRETRTYESGDGWDRTVVLHHGANETFVISDSAIPPPPVAPLIPRPPAPIIPPPPQRAEPTVADTECYRNYWLCAFDSGVDLEIWNDERLVNQQPVDRATWLARLAQELRRSCVITFNGGHYDMPMIALALQGADNARLKAASDAMIVQGVKSWDIAEKPKWIDHIDLFDVAPGQGSLKAYAGKMHSRRLQDLPIDPAATIGPDERAKLRHYCITGDLPATRDLWNTFPSQIELREDMTAEYGVDVRSKSDAQIAEAVMRALLPFKVVKPQVPYGKSFHYRPPEWLQFVGDPLKRLVAELVRHPFWINQHGSPVPDPNQHFIDWGDDQLRPDGRGNWLKRPKGWHHEMMPIGGSRYAVGSGGLHSTEASVVFQSSPARRIRMIDVRSYYPSLILKLGIFPVQIGRVFLSIYGGWYTQRLSYKDAGIKKKANSFKTLLNGTFGKLGSSFSIFYAPSELIQVTVTGQLALLMLIERLELCGVSVISANTDGIVIDCPVALQPLADQIVAWWEQQTGMVMETDEVRTLAARDVNSYVLIQPDGAVKSKGAFAPPEPGPSGWPNPTGQISVDAAIAWLRDGTDISATVRSCTDIRQFIHVRAVKGGGSYSPGGLLEKKPTGIVLLSMFPDPAGRTWRQLSADEKQAVMSRYQQAMDALAAQHQYLGKVVRWYYGANSRGCIVTPTGGLVARTEGCVPLMELPDALPSDVDYGWYIDEAKNMLRSMGVTVDS